MFTVKRTLMSLFLTIIKTKFIHLTHLFFCWFHHQCYHTLVVHCLYLNLYLFLFSDITNKILDNSIQLLIFLFLLWYGKKYVSTSSIPTVTIDLSRGGYFHCPTMYCFSFIPIIRQVKLFLESTEVPPYPWGHHPCLRSKQEVHLNFRLVKSARGTGVYPLPSQNPGKTRPYTPRLPNIRNHRRPVVMRCGKYPYWLHRYSVLALTNTF